ncbi:hypothetical protein RHSIM_Rhsim05G0080200 [Rhododendron simsii]|uniref:Uncharacterized protein n=1 Tax=Rhododendron simsii TaxID=118357 RepID=A0A834LPJ4_RHOSS|nr:hypothetical protein RHSIM_Rhsim05G0080200 [Rhododendron simsii]
MMARSKSQSRKSVLRPLKVKVKKADIVHEEISPTETKWFRFFCGSSDEEENDDEEANDEEASEQEASNCSPPPKNKEIKGESKKKKKVQVCQSKANN